jgi:hypothetical protein
MSEERKYTFGDITATNIVVGDNGRAGGCAAKAGEEVRHEHDHGEPRCDGDCDGNGDGLTDREIGVLAGAYRSPTTVAVLLRRAGLRPQSLPTFDGSLTPLEYWTQVGYHLQLGHAPDGRHRLLATASIDYPANRTFRHGRDRPPTAQE